MYVQFLNLRTKVEEVKSREIEHRNHMTAYLNSMRKMERIIKECD